MSVDLDWGEDVPYLCRTQITKCWTCGKFLSGRSNLERPEIHKDCRIVEPDPLPY